MIMMMMLMLMLMLMLVMVKQIHKMKMAYTKATKTLRWPRCRTGLERAPAEHGNVNGL